MTMQIDNDEVKKLAILLTMLKGKDPLKTYKGKLLWENEAKIAADIVANKHKWLKPVKPVVIIPEHQDWKRFPYK